MPGDLLLAWIILMVSGAAVVFAVRRKHKDELVEAFGLGITVGREFHKMRDEWEEGDEG